ncbi:MAG TPA: hypothetical protein VFT90_07240 [Chryseosolibacter sp.]|nr:hypothetical protein [Chryseosolibacter sp.]
MLKKLFRTCLGVIALLSFFSASAQNYAESALQFSRTKPAGSARILGLGGSQTALGGDYSSALSNPAGLGLYNRGEFTFSLGFTDHQTTSSYYGTGTEDSRSIFNIPGFSYVWNFPKSGEKFLGGSLGVSFSRTNDFNQAITYRGSNQQKSIIDYFIEQANGFTTEQFDPGEYHYNTPTGLGYQNYLIGPISTFDPEGPDDLYFTFAPFPNRQQEMEEIVIKGATNQWSLSYGGNIEDKFFFGAGIGISSLNYESQKNYRETFDTTTVQSLHLVENLSISGTGVNATLGAIVRPTTSLQLGVSYTTPTLYGLTEAYDASMSTRWNNFDYFGNGTTILGDNSNDPIATDIVTSEYRLTTPMRLRGGIAFITEYGFITGDVEYINPAKAKYKSQISGISFSEDNDDIKKVYQASLNYRIGAEFRKDIFRVRAGYGIQTNAYQESIGADNSVSSISGGLGIRTKTFYADLAIVQSASKTYRYQPYTFSDGSGPIAELKDKTLNGVLTIGFTF